METYIFWAIISAITSGLYNFGFKVITQRNYSTYYSSFWSYTVAAMISFLYLLYTEFSGFEGISWSLVILLALGNITFFYLSVITRIESMKNIDNVIFYPLYKTFGPILVTCISLFYFRQTLNFYESLGILVGILVPLMLITRSESKRQKNLYRGLIFMFLTAVATAISPIFVKISNNNNIDTVVYIFMSFIFGIVFSYLGYIFENKKSTKVFNISGLRRFGLVIGVFHFLTFYSFVRAFEGNIAIAFTINSFAILIPIILSIIFYGEHFNLKKAIVIFLSIISILLFI